MPRAFVFDAYGTLFDVHAAIGRHRAAAGPDADRFSEIWRSKQLEYTWTLTLAGRYVDFWTLTERALDFAFARFASVDRALSPSCSTPISRSTPLRMRARCCAISSAAATRTAILSNGSPKMLAAAVEAAEDRRRSRCRALGRCHPHLQAAAGGLCAGHRALRALPPADVVFVSSNRWDVMGAAAFGFRTAWVNRAKLPEEYGPAPDTVLADLNGLMAIE